MSLKCIKYFIVLIKDNIDRYEPVLRFVSVGLETHLIPLFLHLNYHTKTGHVKLYSMNPGNYGLEIRVISRKPRALGHK